MSISVRLGLSPVKVCRVLILCLPFFPASLAQEQCKAFTHSLPDILFTRFKTTQNLRSRSFLLRTARMFECTLFILCCSCPGLSVACNSSLGSVLPPALVPAEKKQWKKVSAGKCDQDGGWKNAKIFMPTVISIDEGRWECENVCSSKVIWLGTLSVENSEGKREKPQRNVVTDLTKLPWRQWQGTNLTSPTDGWAVQKPKTPLSARSAWDRNGLCPTKQLLGKTNGNEEPWKCGEKQTINKPYKTGAEFCQD